MKKYLLLVSVFAAIFILGSNSARAQSDLTWNELKTQQTTERVSMENMQKETLKNIVEIHRMQIEKMRSDPTSSTNDMLLLTDKLKAERSELNKQFSEERIKLVQIHAEERKVYLSKPK